MNMAGQCLLQPSGWAAIIDLTGPERRKVSYGDLSKIVDGLARAMSARIAPGDRVGVLLGQSPWCAAAHLAIWKTGAISVPLVKLFNHQALTSRIGDSGLALMLSDDEGAALACDLAECWRAETCGVSGAPVPSPEAAPDTPAVLIYTSGTTGTPKGALHGHGALRGHLPGVTLSHEGLGEAGDIAVRRGAPSMMLRYWQRPEDTAAKFRRDWMLTGGRGGLREGEYIRFVGREDDVITSAGYRIGPAEIEDYLLKHPAVATVGVVGKPDALRTEAVKAYVVLRAGVAASGTLAGELRVFVKERLARYLYPTEITFLPELPITVTGKVIRRALKARAAQEADS